MTMSRIRKYYSPHWTDGWDALQNDAKSLATLHIGSGFSPIPGATTVDLNPLSNPDIVWDLNRTPWPFPDSNFDMVVALSIVEHLDNFLSVMGEIHRVSRAGAIVHMLVPHFSSGASHVDPTHKQHLSARSCDYFVKGTLIEKEYGFYVPWRYELVMGLIELAPFWRYWPGAAWLARRHTGVWEDYLCYVIRGAGIFWKLRVVKQDDI